ncbi:MAG: flagellar filament capping protein FliD, partial [Turicibacter sp.]
MAGIQIGGIISGFDTASMVEEMMKAERVKVDKVFQQKSVVEFQKEAYTAINDKYSSFILNMRKTFGLESQISNNGLTRPSALNNLSWLNKATSSNESIASTKASSAAKPGNYELTVKELADNVKFASESNITLDPSKPLSEQGINIDITVTTKDGDVIIQDTDGTMTLEGLAKQLNNIEGMSASYDQTLNRFFIQTDQTGADNFVKINDNNNSGILQSLNLTSGPGNSIEGTGKNAKVDFNGATDIEFSSNNFNIQGIDYNVKSTGTVKVVVDTDVDAVLEKVTTFVDEYNKLVKDIGDILSEPKYRDYQPLTDAQKKEMSEKEI